MSTPSRSRGLTSSPAQTIAILAAPVRSAITTLGGLGSAQAMIQRAAGSTTRGRGSGRSSRASDQGRSQSVPRRSVAAASKSANLESTQVLTPATGTIPSGTSATSGTAGSDEGPVASSENQGGPAQVPCPGLQRAINYFQGQLGLPVSDGSTLVPSQAQTENAAGSQTVALSTAPIGNYGSTSQVTNGVTPLINSATPRVRAAIPSYKGCTIGSQINPTNSGFNPFLVNTDWVRTPVVAQATPEASFGPAWNTPFTETSPGWEGAIRSGEYSSHAYQPTTPTTPALYSQSG
ncbi:hypothetical protein F444_22411 [Phytophthora nicotianae P1976]|uniref:Uncharacterized protein n=1 Tax=Phytophthora nicotianae P1976 TaxID=1317066 RepID=A0A080YXV2_PHYNI|nr:hypothetical protein F444_22411 [Phytophthora nicotianae P1976]